MKTLSQIATVFFGAVLWMQAQEEGKKVLDFSLLRQNDVIDIPSDGKNGLYENLKQIEIGKESKLSFGGSYRFQSEAFINEEFATEVDQDDIWFLNRFQFHSHLKFANTFELFAELNSSLMTSKQNLAPVDRDELSFNQLFAQYHFNTNWRMLVGRQNMRLGSGRLIDVREGPNVRLSFDMAQLQYQDQNSELTTFYAVPVRVGQWVFDNEALNFQESLGAVYWTQHWNRRTSTDIYMIYKEEEAKTWDSGTADDNRLSLGLRHFGNWNKLRYNNEFVFQTGRFGEQDIRAWTVSFNIEHPFLVTNSSIGLKTEAISGDTSNTDTTLNTFDGLYPRGAYFGRVARIGPSNLFDIHPYVDMSMGRFTFQFDYVAFWRLSRQDGVYGPPLNLQYPSVNEERFIGHQLGSIASFEVNGFIALELEANVIFPGAFLVESGLDNTLFHAVFTAEFKF
ncbi:alginate export family protein [Muricauda sp. SCSIO 64092]|uniref:alginate export family protein n=1 Tax=Allomuricauda sp. SCSIO 64092 TaxID=2908842 RepID=UPI001FF12FDC|nr:alginate export family protein [Muricauda sp. SCSIO 64092]UOY08956.1 alginate export family protein [Muricauda sp. SCSIO 64092]